MDGEALGRLLRYKSWANARSFERLTVLSSDELAAPQPIKFGSIERTLQHILDMDRVWQAHLTGRMPTVASRTPTAALPFAELRSEQQDADAWFEAWAADASPAALSEAVHFEFLDGGTGTMTRAEMLLHVVNHATYHRGHVADMLYHLGRVPAVTDYPVFVRAGQ